VPSLVFRAGAGVVDRWPPLAAVLLMGPAMATRSLVRDLLLAASLLGAGCAGKAAQEPPQQAQLTRAVSSPRRLEAPDYLPEAARSVLRTMMASHAHSMGDLMSAIMVLDYPRIHEGAEAIASDASLSRPLTNQANELNALLPEEFFRQQDALRAQARVLVDAATRQSPYGVADAYGHLSESCVRCHYVYRSGLK
jgi:cytochrome c556